MRASTEFVDCPGEQLLAGAALARSNTATSVDAIFSMLRSTLDISGLLAMIPSIGDAAVASRSLRFSASRSNMRSARVTISCSTSISIGFW